MNALAVRSPSWLTLFVLASCLATTTRAAAEVTASTEPVTAEPLPAEWRGPAFWAPVVRDCTAPEGESVVALVKEAVALLGSPRSEWRDDVGYGVVASCVYQKRALRPAERRELVAQLAGNLRHGIGEVGKDSVLLRSFSALDLSLFAALEHADPALDAAEFRRLLDAAFDYLRDERDLRGLCPRVGWIHATAHTADLLNFLARDARFTPADQKRLLDEVAAKLITPGTEVFSHAEEERLAAALVSVVARSDFDPSLFDPWLARFVALERRVWTQAPPDPALLDAAQNGRSLLRCLYVQLSLPAAAPSSAAGSTAPGDATIRDKLLATLAAIRR